MTDKVEKTPVEAGEPQSAGKTTKARAKSATVKSAQPKVQPRKAWIERLYQGKTASEKAKLTATLAMGFSAIALIGVAVCGAMCDKCDTPKVAVVDVPKVLTGGVQGEKVKTLLQSAQSTLRHNLEVVEKKLSTYKDQEQAQQLKQEAAANLQREMNNFNQAVTVAVASKVETIVRGSIGKYEVIVPKASVLAFNDAVEITDEVLKKLDQEKIDWPLAPNAVEVPVLPPDNGLSVNHSKKGK